MFALCLQKSIFLMRPNNIFSWLRISLSIWSCYLIGFLSCIKLGHYANVFVSAVLTCTNFDQLPMLSKHICQMNCRHHSQMGLTFRRLVKPKPKPRSALSLCHDAPCSFTLHVWNSCNVSNLVYWRFYFRLFSRECLCCRCSLQMTWRD